MFRASTREALLQAPVGARRFVTRTTHEQWGWRAPSRGFAMHLVKRIQCTKDDRHGDGTQPSAAKTDLGRTMDQLIQSQVSRTRVLAVQNGFLSALARGYNEYTTDHRRFSSAE